jgi:DNA-binding XRE family transcriptional regulator
VSLTDSSDPNHASTENCSSESWGVLLICANQPKGAIDAKQQTHQQPQYSEQALALEAGVDRTYISQIERGVGNPSVLVLLKIAIILRVDVSDLFIKNI